MRFRVYFESKETGITPRLIYNFYFLYTYSQTVEMDSVGHFLVNDFARRIKEVYLFEFKRIVFDQLMKYERRGRIDSDFMIGDSFEKMDILMRKTYRSDMKRRNVNWEMLTGLLVSLDRAVEAYRIFFLVDRINNCIHNTGGSMMGKFINGGELTLALDRCHRLVDLREFRPFIDREYRRLV